MNGITFDLKHIRMEISFKSYEQLRLILSFYEKNSLLKINIPCKNNLKKYFLLNSIKIAREEFPSIEIIPHFSILHEFRRNRYNTQNSLIEFLQHIKYFGCNEFLLVSGSQKRSTLDSVSSLNFLRNDTRISNIDFSIGVAFNPYLPGILFEEEIAKLEEKLQSGLVKSIWIQFGTDYILLEARIHLLKSVILSYRGFDLKTPNINLFGSILIPSKQFLARFKYRPWKGVYCSPEFLDSLDHANNIIRKLLIIYSKYKICPLIETSVINEVQLNKLKTILQV